MKHGISIIVSVLMSLISATLMSQNFIYVNQIGYPSTATKQALAANAELICGDLQTEWTHPKSPSEILKLRTKQLVMA